MFRLHKRVLSFSWSRNVAKWRKCKAIFQFSQVRAILPIQDACCNMCQYASKESSFPNMNLQTRFQMFCTIVQKQSEFEYEVIADETLDSLAEMFEDIPDRLECDSEYDVSISTGVLTVKIGKKWGTYVINKQTPNKQLWLSSPKSGPKRYDFIDGVWVYKHDGVVLHDFLTEEISKLFSHNIDFTKCSYGSKQ